MEDEMNKKDFVWKVFSLIPSPDINVLTPIKLQKLFFLIEKRVGQEASFFNFQPYLYGPYDKDLKDTVDSLVEDGVIGIGNANGVKYYKLNTPANNDDMLDQNKRDFIQNNLFPFVLTKSFKDLCLSIYKEFPEMAKNSVLIQKGQI
jgi:hypothetical protein